MNSLRSKGKVYYPFVAALLLSGFTLLMTGCSPHQSNKTNAEKVAPISVGHQLFLAHCIRCHTGSGNPPGPEETILSSNQLYSEDSFRKLLRQPTSAMMKSFTPQELNDTQIHTLYEYILTARKAKP